MTQVQILDPGTGTGTFLADIVKFIHESFRGQQGVWSDYVRDDLLPRLNGFEILMAPYAMAHVKLEMILRETGFELGGERLRIFLTNSLENREAETKMKNIPFANWLVSEARGADAVKRDAPVFVVIGNPPYAVSSSNRGRWIQKLIEDYKDGLQETNIQPLSDDYIKFIRYGQFLVEKTGEGVLAYISNNSFVDGLIHRQMRRCLLDAFDQIYILNLHGDSRKKERAPDGSKDQNVFDIMQGVSINFFVKTGKKKNGTHAEVFHFDLFGERAGKYDFLCNRVLNAVDFQKLETPSPNFFFVPKDLSAQAEFEAGFGVQEIFAVSNSGIQSKRDSLFINMDKVALSENIRTLLSDDMDDVFASKYHVVDSSSYKITKSIKGKKFNYGNIVEMTYRPFDVQWVYYDKDVLGRASYKAMRHMLAGDNLGFMTSRSYSTNTVFDSVFITRHTADIHAAGGQTYFFPLYLCPIETQKTIGGETARKPNLNADIVQQLADQIGLRFVPEQTDAADTFAPVDLLDYIYAALHSPAYRNKFREFLKIDFPRVPYPRDREHFLALVNLGAELRALHLLESAKLNTLITTYPESGSNTVTAVKFDDGKVRINKTQYFGEVPQTAWDFYIGGYQPAQKYLKDRKGRALTPDEIRRYQQIIVALVETAKLMAQIDAVA